MAAAAPPAQIAGTKRSAEEASLEISRDRKGKRFQGCATIKNYVLMSKLGEGTFGEVYKAESRITGEIVALKKILMHQEKDGFPVTAIREIKLLKSLSHPNVLRLEEMAMERAKGDNRKKATVYMVTPYMDHDLAGLLENPTVSLTAAQLKCYMMQLLRGVEYLHRSKILHRDMKAANLLINNDGLLQIADFGLARTYDDAPPQPGQGNGIASRAYTSVVVTRWYRPPELLLHLRNYTPAIDMWGVGCVFGEMFKKRPILPGTSDMNQLHLIFDMVGSPTESNMPGWSSLPGCDGVKTFQQRNGSVSQVFGEQGSLFVSLLQELLKLDWNKRINAVDALDHPYFRTEPLPVDASKMPSFPESHELDRRKFREQRANPPPAPAGGTVGMGPEHDTLNGTTGQGPRASNNARGFNPGPDAHRGSRSLPGQAFPPGQAVNRMPSRDEPAQQPPRQHAWDKKGHSSLPQRPPVEVPRGPPSYSSSRHTYEGRPREVHNGNWRPRGHGSVQTDSYIPTYAPRRDDTRPQDGQHRRDERTECRPAGRRDTDDRNPSREPSRSVARPTTRER